MTAETTTVPLKSTRRGKPQLQRWRAAIGLSLVIYIFVSRMILKQYPNANLRFRIDFDPLLQSPMILQIHVASAISTFFIGLLILNLPKGIQMHRTLGWIWVVTMAMTAGSSFFLRGMTGDSMSVIHGLSAWTLISLPMAVAAIRKRNVQSHAKNMTSLFLGGMAIAGIFTFLPGRLMWSLFFAV